jgi:hypothetical protein
MRIPSSIENSDILKAMRQIDKQTPRYPKKRASTIYDLHHGGRIYPPKYVLSLANQFPNGTELHGFTGGTQTNNFLIARGFADIRNKKTGKKIVIVAEDEDEATAYAEGKESFALHRKLERNPKLARKAKNKRLRDTGDLRCDACDFSFQEYYGAIGIGFIEAHHTVPISKFKGRTRITRLEEIALVCSNCHRMLHRVTPLPSISDLRTRVKKKG